MSAVRICAGLRVFISSLRSLLRKSLAWRGFALAGILALGVLSWLSLDCRSASAAALTWDPSGSLSGSFGGGGSWNTSTKNWWNGTTTAAWSSGSDAWFTGPNAAGTVTVTGNLSAADLIFSEDGYTLSGGSVSLTSGTINVMTGNTTLSSTLAGTGPMYETGSGTLTLNAANTFTGLATINQGVLYANAPTNTSKGALGNASGIVINSGGTLAVSTANSNSLIGTAGTSSKTITINSGGLLESLTNSTDHLNQLVFNGGTLSVAAVETPYGSFNLDGGVSTAGSGNTSYMLGGNVSLTQSNASAATSFNIHTGDTLYVSTSIQNLTGITSRTLAKDGAGTLILAASNNYATTTQVNAGTLLLANPGALTASPLSISAGTVSLAGINSISIVSLAGNAAGVLLLTNTDGSSANLTVAGATSTAYNGSLTGSGGSLTMNGPSTLTLGGTNTYTGTTTLAGGVLVLNNAFALPAASPVNFAGGTLRFTPTTPPTPRANSSTRTTRTLSSTPIARPSRSPQT